MRYNFRALACAALLATMFAASCDTGGSPVPPDPSTFTVYSSGEVIGVSAPADSADPGTAVNITAGGTGSRAANADGSVSFKATVSAGTIRLSYTKSGQQLTSDASVQSLITRVTKPLFSTGAAPNDMVLADNSLFIANSLDNTVVRYSPAGVVEDTATFDQFASPSYLDSFQGTLYVTTNGDNFLTTFAQDDLVNPVDHISLEASEAFLGPGKPAFASFLQPDYSVIVPCAAIESFGSPSVYGDSSLRFISLPDGPVLKAGGLPLHNGNYAAVSEARQEVFFVSAGELQFDAQFNPSITTDSYLTVITDLTDVASAVLINLGPVGASSMALSPDGNTAYLGNLISGNLYKVDLVNRTVLRGQGDPIHLTNEFTYISDLEFLPGTTLLLATSFNTDELYVIDTATDTVSPAPYPGPFDLSLDPQLLGGAIGVEVDNSVDPPVAYVLYSVANSVARVNLLP
ncbi:MAG: hypothetical protein M3R04_03975 [bacterium]|nr:hypothetical protein [bacterium]